MRTARQLLLGTYGESVVPVLLLVLQLSTMHLDDLSKRLDLDAVLLSQVQHERIKLALCFVFDVPVILLNIAHDRDVLSLHQSHVRHHLGDAITCVQVRNVRMRFVHVSRNNLQRFPLCKYQVYTFEF